MKARLGMALLAVGILAACKQGESPEAMQARTAAVADSAKAAINAGREAWMRFTNQNHSDSIQTLFVSGGLMMPPDAPAAMGSDSISARLRTLTIPGGTLTITSKNIEVSDPIAIDHDVYTYSAPAQGRMPAMNITGKALVHYHHVGNAWKIAEILWNSDAPVPPMPAAARH